MFLTHLPAQLGKALPVKVSHRFAASSAVFDDDHLVSCAGPVPVMALATQTGLPELLTSKVHIAEPRIKSGSANPAPKLTTVIAGMCAGADSIDDLDLVRAGRMKTLFDGVYAPSTVGTLLREFTFGHATSSTTCPSSTSFTVTTAAMTASLVGQAGPDQTSLAAAPRIVGGQARTAAQPTANCNDPTQPGHSPRRSEAGLTGWRFRIQPGDFRCVAAV